MCDIFIIKMVEQGHGKHMQFNVSANRVVMNDGPVIERTAGEVGVESELKILTCRTEKRKTWGVTEDRGVQDSGRRHQMGERERGVGCCHYP